MKNKKQVISTNYLEKIPVCRTDIKCTTENDTITLQIENKGWANRLAQMVFKRPKTSYIHLDEFGSFVWQLIDGEQNITAMGVKVKEHFGEKAEPLYPRLAKFFQILNSYGFVEFKD